MRYALLLILVVLPAPVLAQNTCAAGLQAAYASTRLECADLNPGEVCYGSRTLEITALDEGHFDRPGDRISGLQTLESEAAGIAITRFPLNHPDRLVTMLILGEVTLENLSEAEQPVLILPLRVSFAAGAILRSEPDAESNQVAPLLSGQQLNATGVLESGEWLRLLLDDGRSGWVRADLVTLEGDVALLPVVTADDAPPESLLSPLQVLEFTSGEINAECRDAPPAGLLLQTDEAVTLNVNGAELLFDGTVFIQREADMFVHVLEGSATVTSADVSQRANAGQRLRLPEGEDGLGAPYAAELYIYVQMRALPLDLLPRPLESLPVSLYGLATPAVPDQAPLVTLTGADPCTIAAVNSDVRLRLGPGQYYPVQMSLQPGETIRPDARAEGTDGQLWWRLAQDLWVRSDVVLSAGT
jgi:hypothetical protein